MDRAAIEENINKYERKLYTAEISLQFETDT